MVSPTARTYINDASMPLAARLKASEENPFNTLYLDRNCASCMTGFAPQVLNHIKLACLSYVNSPIKYSTTYVGSNYKRNSNPKNSVEMTFTEIAFIKEFLLLKCQGILSECD